MTKPILPIGDETLAAVTGGADTTPGLPGMLDGMTAEGTPAALLALQNATQQFGAAMDQMSDTMQETAGNVAGTARNTG